MTAMTTSERLRKLAEQLRKEAMRDVSPTVTPPPAVKNPVASKVLDGISGSKPTTPKSNRRI